MNVKNTDIRSYCSSSLLEHFSAINPLKSLDSPDLCHEMLLHKGKGFNFRTVMCVLFVLRDLVSCIGCPVAQLMRLCFSIVCKSSLAVS